MRAAEWDVLHPLDGSHIAVIRLVLLGPHRDPFYRVVTPQRDRSERKLLGYWSTLERAHDAALALYERATGSAIEGGGRPPGREVSAQKPPPRGYPTGVAAPVARARTQLAEAAAASRRG